MSATNSLTSHGVKPPTESKGYFSSDLHRWGRPSLLPDLYPEPPRTPFDLALAELDAGRVNRPALRLIVADTARIFDIAGAARQLHLTAPEAAQLCREFHAKPTEPETWQRRRYRSSPLETAEQRKRPTSERIRHLWQRGLADGEIAKRVGLTRVELRQRHQPRHEIGACRQCVDYYLKQPARLSLQRCEHYAITFSFDGSKARRVAMNAEQFLAEVRRVEPKATKPLREAWKSSGARQSVARWLQSRVYGKSDLQGHYGDIMTQPGGKKSLLRDFQQYVWR